MQFKIGTEELVAVVDTETTGLFPGGNDRIVEVAALLLDYQGNLVDSYETLLNPARDLGPTHIHGIRGEEIISAPTFEEIAGDLVSFLSRASLLVGHNVFFDVRFIEAELRRIGIDIAWRPPLVDTYRCTGLSLEESCYQFDVALDVQYHSATGDVEATANLAFSLLHEGELYFDGGHRGLGLPTVIPRSTPTVPRKSAAEIASKQSGFLASLADRVVYSLRQDDETRFNYLTLLREALEDRVLDESEIETLSDFAETAGLGRAALEGLHKEFLAQMVCAALDDGVITEHELSDLKRLTRLLDLSPDTLEDQIAAEEPRQSSDAEKSTTDLCGSMVCFTGTIISNIAGEVITKNRAKELAAAAGLIPKSGVSKSLDILVVADPDTLSGKAKKAREYGIRIVVERDFWAMIGVEVN